MPKIGAEPDNREHNTRCKKCKCLVEKSVSRFGFNGRPVKWAYTCANPYHNCGTAEREFCEPVRVYEPTAHTYWDGAGGEWEHPGRAEDCEMPECTDRMSHRSLKTGDRHPGPYASCTDPSCEPPY